MTCGQYDFSLVDKHRLGTLYYKGTGIITNIQVRLLEDSRLVA